MSLDWIKCCLMATPKRTYDGGCHVDMKCRTKGFTVIRFGLSALSLQH
jgi:hypothetical protein